MRSFGLVSELTLASGIQLRPHFRFPFLRQRPMWVPRVSKGATRQSSATTAVITNHVWEGQGVDNQSVGGADERVTEVLEFWGLAGGRRPRLLTGPPALSTASLRTSASPPASGLAVDEFVDTARRATSCWKPPGCARSIWCSPCAWTAGAARWSTAYTLSAEENSLMGRFHDFDNV